MSVNLTLEVVNTSVQTQMDHSSAHVTVAIACHLMVEIAVVSDFLNVIQSLNS